MTTRTTESEGKREGIPVEASDSDRGITVDGRYLLEACVGVGGMGTVYRAHDRVIDRHVAIKRLHASRLADQTHLFQREYHTLKHLAHPSIVGVYDYGVDEEQPYYTMELLDGCDVSSLAPIPWRETCAILRDLASALSLVHARGFVHRDVSGRNLRLANDGRAKLIDFGSMVPFGKPVKTVGTPPFIAPEALYRQPLDGRADLFALGILAHFLLTGQHAYESVDLPSLMNAWSIPPAPLGALVPDAPPAMIDLVMSLLSLSVGARPRSATEVIDKLTATASLPTDGSLQVARSHLTTPKLIGREPQLQQLREQVARVSKGDGGQVLWIEGKEGVGRSRMLAEFSLEAQLAGIKVVTLDGGQCIDGAFSGARILVEELLRAFPGIDPRLPPPLAVLGIGSTGSEKRPAAGPRQAISNGEIETLQRALITWFRDTLGQVVAFIAVDDIEQVDTPSQALITLLAREIASYRVLIAATVIAQPLVGPLVLLRQEAVALNVRRLRDEHVRTLLASIFGEVPGLQRLAQYVQGAARGNPRTCMELLQFLVDEGFARYGGGSWQLLEDIDASALPQGYLATLRARFDALSPAARELASALAIAAPTDVPPRDHDRLLGQTDSVAARDALTELETAQVVTVHEAGQRFANDGWAKVAGSHLQPKSRSALHLRIAGVIDPNTDPLAHGYHLVLGGAKAAGVDMFVGKLERIMGDDLEQRRHTAFLMGEGNARAQLETILEACTQLERPARESFLLALALTQMGGARTDATLVNEHYPTIAAQLKRDSGFHLYESLPQAMAHDVRLQRALSGALQQYESTAARDRVLRPYEAIHRLASLSLSLTTLGLVWGTAHWNDEALTLLRPFTGFAPRIRTIVERLDSFVPLLQGNHLEYRKRTLELLERLERAELEGPPPGLVQLLTVTCTQGIAMMDAIFGLEDVSTRAAVLDSQPAHRVNARRLQALAQLARGHLEQAREHQRAAETLALHNPTQVLDGTFLTVEAWLHSTIGDPLGLKPLVGAMGRRADRHAGWTPAWLLYRGRHAELCGDVEQALVHYTRALSHMTPGKHLLWAGLVARCTAALTLQGDIAAALAFGVESLETGARFNHGYLWMLEGTLALAEAHAGKHVAAAERAQRVVDFLEGEGVRGVVLGNAYEARARVALIAGDSASRDTYTALLRQQWPVDQHPALAARYEKLLEDARLTPRDPSAVGRPAWSGAVTRGDECLLATAVRCQLRAHADLDARCRAALGLIMQCTQSDRGYLFLSREGGSELKLHTIEASQPPPAGLKAALESLLRRRIDGEEETCEYDAADQTAYLAECTLGPDALKPVVLISKRGELVGVAALHRDHNDSADLPEQDFYRVVADCLLEVALASPRSPMDAS